MKSANVLAGIDQRVQSCVSRRDEVVAKEHPEQGGFFGDSNVGFRVVFCSLMVIRFGSLFEDKDSCQALDITDQHILLIERHHR